MLSPGARQAILFAPPGWVLKAGGQRATLDLDFVNDRAWIKPGGRRTIASLLSVTGGVSTGSFYTKADGTLQSFANNVPRYGTNGLLVEEARTNVALWNRDQTNAAWTKTDCTAAKDQTGPDGVSNSASSLTATGANATSLQAITLASSARFQTAYVKRITGSGTINMTMDNGTTWTAVTVTAGWTRVSIPTQTLANPTVGFRIVTSGDAIAVDLVQNENGTFATSAIPTTTASVTRAAENITLTDFSVVSQTVQTVYGQFQANQAYTANENLCEIASATRAASGQLYIGASNTLTAQVFATGFATQAAFNISATDTALNKMAGVFQQNDFAAVVNGGTVSTDTSGTWPDATLTKLQLGADAVPGSRLNGTIKRLALWNARISNAAIQALTA